MSPKNHPLDYYTKATVDNCDYPPKQGCCQLDNTLVDEFTNTNLDIFTTGPLL